MRIAAIDIGTNSVHLVVADVGAGGEITPVDTARVQVMLGSGGFTDHKIRPDAFQRGVDALSALKAACDSHGVEDIYASATSAVREASNGAAFCKAVKDATGIHVRVISGADEARLIWLGVRPALDFSRGPVLVFDLGGGSTELIHGDGGGVRHAQSLHLGHIRLADQFHRSETLTDADHDALKRHIKGEISAFRRLVRPDEVANLVGTSGTVRCLARMAIAARTGALPDHDEGLVLPRKDLEKLIDRMKALPKSRLHELPAMDVRRRDTLLSGAILVREIMKTFRADELRTSERSLREGLLVDWVLNHRPELDLSATVHNPRERSVLLAVQRFGADEVHARQVARLAEALFDGTARLHQLSSADRELLHHAAWLHDIGHHISGQDHPKHGQYLVQNIRLYGFTAPEVAVLGNLVRYHSRNKPKLKHADFASLSRQDQRRVRLLAGMLQVADGLDRSHNQPVDRLDVSIARGRVELIARVEDGGDLERWEVDQRKGLLAEALGVEVDLDVVVGG